jgi:DNA anti-recombination protein RmuC
MQMIVDFVLLAASAAAAIYCFVLSARLKRLNDVRGGLGATIASMSATIEQTREMLEDTKQVSRAGEKKLRDLIEDAERLAPEIADLVDALAEAAETAAFDIEQSRNEALREIRRSCSEPQRALAALRRGERAA